MRILPSGVTSKNLEKEYFKSTNITVTVYSVIAIVNYISVRFMIMKLKYVLTTLFVEYSIFRIYILKIRFMIIKLKYVLTTLLVG